MAVQIRETHEYMRTGDVETTSPIVFDNETEAVIYMVQSLKDMNDVAEGRRTPRFFNPISFTIERV